MKQQRCAPLSLGVLLTAALYLAGAASTAIAGHGSKDMPIWAPSVGIQFAANMHEVEIGMITSARVIDAGKLTRFIDNPAFSCAQGDTIKIMMMSETRFEMLFPRQLMKVKAHFTGTGGNVAAIIDWLGSLEAAQDI